MSIRFARALASTFVVSATLAAQTPAPVPQPGLEHKRLDAFVGKWSSEGEAQPSPYGPAGKMTSVETFAWLPGGFFMIHQWDTRQGAVEIKGMEIMGYDGRSKVYTSRFFDNFGNSGSAKATLHGNTWIWAGRF